MNDVARFRVVRATVLAVAGLPLFLVQGIPLAMMVAFYLALAVSVVVSVATDPVARAAAPKPPKAPADLGGRDPSLAEYALILSLVAVVSITALLFLGGQISKIIDAVAGQGTPAP